MNKENGTKITRRDLLKSGVLFAEGLALMGIGIKNYKSWNDELDSLSIQAFPTIKNVCGPAANPGNYACAYETSDKNPLTLENFYQYRKELASRSGGISRILLEFTTVCIGLKALYDAYLVLQPKGDENYD